MMHGTQEIRHKKHSPDAYPTRPTATTLHNHNTNIAVGSVTILKSKSAPKPANKQVHYGIASMHVDKINKEMMYDTQRKYAKKIYAHKKTSSQKGTPTNVYATRATPYSPCSINIGAKRDTCQTDVENTSVQFRHKKMGNAPK